MNYTYEFTLKEGPKVEMKFFLKLKVEEFFYRD